MFNLKHPKSQLLALVCSTAILAALPVTFEIGGKDGFVSMKPAFALADSDNDSGSDDSDGGSDDDNSGSGDDSGSDHSGSDDDSDDDNSGSDDSDDDSSGSGHSSDDDGSDDDNSSDDNSSGSGAGNGSTTEGNGTKIVKFESTSNSLEAVFADGTKVEIANGRYERKDAAGNTVEERRATQADADRILALR